MLQQYFVKCFQPGFLTPLSCFGWKVGGEYAPVMTDGRLHTRKVERMP